MLSLKFNISALYVGNVLVHHSETVTHDPRLETEEQFRRGWSEVLQSPQTYWFHTDDLTTKRVFINEANLLELTVESQFYIGESV